MERERGSEGESEREWVRMSEGGRGEGRVREREGEREGSRV